MTQKILLFGFLFAWCGCDQSLDENFHPGIPSTVDAPSTDEDTPVTEEPSVNCNALDTSNYNVEMVAGTVNTSGSTNGTLLGSTFNLITVILFKSATQLVARDENNFLLRQIDLSADAVTTFAGNGVNAAAGDGGALISASFSTTAGPGMMALKSNGDILIPSPEHYIRLISSGTVSSFAGLNGTSGTADGTLSTARFNSPSAVALDASENIFVADTLNHCLRKIDTAGNVTTFAGLCGTAGDSAGNGTAARITSPFSIVVDSSDNVFVSSSATRRIYKVTPSGDLTFFAGDGSAGDADGTGVAAKIQPVVIGIDACDTIFFSDNALKVKKVNTTGVVTTIAGAGGLAHTGDGGPALSADFNAPTGVAVNPDTHEIYISERFGDTIRKLVPQ